MQNEAVEFSSELIRLLKWQDNTTYNFKDNLGRKWSVPLSVIAKSCSNYYANVDGISQIESLEQTLKLFKSDKFEIKDWARNNMDWNDVKDVARVIDSESKPLMQESWVNSPSEIITGEYK